uniref:Putative DNA mismatch repair protein MutL n=1 Tax=Moniliophthora roreri TaxID=221103 RepID=A0A0W0EWG8_MONRR
MSKADAEERTFSTTKTIKAIDANSVHQITSGQVVIDLQTAVKELVENSLDAGATSIEVRFKNYGLKSIEVVDNGSGIPEKDFDDIGRKHYTSKLSSFEDLTRLTSFGFRGEAISSLCALCEGVTVTTATAEKAPMGTVLDLGKAGDVKKKTKASRQRGTTVLITTPFVSLPVRRKELERNIKREFGKALSLLNAYALGPCCGLYAGVTTDSDSDMELRSRAVRFVVSNQPDKGSKTTHISLPLPSSGVAPSVRSGVIALWGTKALDSVMDLELQFDVPRIKPRRLNKRDDTEETREETFPIRVKGLISSPVPMSGSSSTQRSSRTSTDRQFFFVNGRPCTLNKVQKVINDTYRSFTASNSSVPHFPFIVADFNVPGDAVDVNVTPDKRTILVHAEVHVIDALKTALEDLFSPSRSTFSVNGPPRTGSLKASTPQGGVYSSVKPTQDQIHTHQTKEASSKPHTPVQEGLPHPVIVTDDKDSDYATVNATRGDLEVCSSEVNPSLSQVPTPDVMDVDQEAGLTTHTPTPFSAPRSCEVSGMRNSSIPPISSVSQKNSQASAAAEAHCSSAQKSQGDQDPTTQKGKDRGAIVVSTVGASWTRKVTASLQQDEDANADPEQSTGAGHDRSDDDLAGMTEEDAPPRKKRRSVSTAEATPMAKLGSIVSSSGIRTANGRMTGQGTSSSSKQLTLTDAFRGSNARQALRTRLAGFVRSGSQVPTTSVPDAQTDEDEEEMEVVHEVQRQEPDEPMDDAPLLQPQETPLFLPERENDQPERDHTVMDVDTLDGTSSVGFVDSSSSISLPPTSLSIGSNNNSSSSATDLIDLTADNDDDDAIDGSLLASIDPQSMSRQRIVERVDRPEVIRTTSSNGDVHLRLDIAGIQRRWNASRKRIRGVQESLNLGDDLGRDECLQYDDNPEAKLSRIIRKTDFAKMTVLGQFNLGFIIVRKRERGTADGGHEGNGPHDDLFIVDQHAADEKYNFENLQRECNIRSQKLIRPLPLDLMASDELMIAENPDVLKQSGFELEVQDDDILTQPSDGARPARLKLTALPMSKGTIFDMKDGPMLQGSSYVCVKGMQEKRHGWHATHERPDEYSGSTHGYYGPALELSPRKAYNEAPVRHVKY